MSDDAEETALPKITDLYRVVTTPAVIQVNEAGEKRPALFVNMITSDGGMTFCFSPEELTRLIAQLTTGLGMVEHTEEQMQAVDWESLRPDE